jgi:class 3 adenylate cyclase
VLASSAVREAAGDGDEFSFAESRTVRVAGHEPVPVLPLRAI